MIKEPSPSIHIILFSGLVNAIVTYCATMPLIQQLGKKGFGNFLFLINSNNSLEVFPVVEIIISLLSSFSRISSNNFSLEKVKSTFVKFFDLAFLNEFFLFLMHVVSYIFQH